MSHHFATPGVYIEEVTGPGVIAGVSTSTAAFIGPALRGVVNEARRISSFDEFLEQYGIQEPDGSFWPYITSPHWFYMAHAVRGFFENGGQQAYIVRVGTGLAAAWDVKNQAQPDEVVFRAQAIEEGLGGNSLKVQVQPANATGAGGVVVANDTAQIDSVNGLEVTLKIVPPFRPGDIVTENEPVRATITRIQGKTLTLSKEISNLKKDDILRIANIIPSQNTFRMAKTDGLYPGSVVQISGQDADTNQPAKEYAVVESVDQAGFVTLASTPERKKKYSLTAANAPVLISQEFRLIITPPGAAAETFDKLSLNPVHPNYIFSVVNSSWVRILPPVTPPTAAKYPDQLVNPPAGNVAVTVAGQNDNPGALASADFRKGLNVLRDIDDVNLVCIPDAAAHKEYLTIQKDMLTHCLLLKDRFAILDSRLGVLPSGPGSVEEQRGHVQVERGFAALYYPWLEVPEPVRPPRQRPPIPSRLRIPPSGHMAGIYARTDAERGVHKAPANTDVRSVLGLELRLSDGQQGPLNLKGINALRIFPGSGQVTVWGARTTVDPIITDWVYVNIRRLMLYLEESIEEGIRWAVFEPNNLQLWQKLKRTITEFLTRVWRDGALFGETADQAFYVRIDEALNPPSTRALGRLYIEIGVRPSYPAEFIIVRIGIWPGGAEVSER